MSTNPLNEDEKPGTSASFTFQDSPNANDMDKLVLHYEIDSEPVSNESSVKVRNASRDRPSTDRPNSKRFRAAEDDNGIHMDTNSSDEDMEIEAPDENSEDSEHSDPDELIPVQDALVDDRSSHSIPEQTQFQRSFTEDAGPSTHAQSFAPSGHSLDYPPEFGPDERHQLHNPNDTYYYYGNDDHNYAARVMDPSFPNPAVVPSSVRNLPKTTMYENEYHNYQDKEPGEKAHENTRLMLARKIFLLSTELVFPGIISYNETKFHIPKNYMGDQVRSSLWLQILLRTDQLFFVLWILSFLCTSDILIFILKELHGYLTICLTCLFILIHIVRLRFGLKGNETDEVQCLALYWMITVIVQIPLFSFILLTHLFAPVLLAFNVTMDVCMLLFIIIESVVGFIHFRDLLESELKIIRMIRRHKEAHALWLHALDVQYQEDLAGQSGNLEEERWLSYMDDEDAHSVDNDSDYAYETNPIENMDFQMQIRRLSEQSPGVGEDDDGNDSDSSEQVTSTSDAIRQRPIRAH